MDFSTHLRRIGPAATILAIGLGLAACGGSGPRGSSGNLTGSSATCNPADPATSSECGNVLVALTDADGDFASYTVDVLSISLERADGTRVETLPEATRIDFAQLTELSELVSATTLAPGDIVGGRILIDYSDAEIFVEAGGDIVPAEIVDGDGMPLGTVEVDIQLADRDQLVITRGRVGFLSIDFDLSASNTVDTSTSPPVVTAEPFLVAEVAPLDQKDIRVRGTLVDVDVANSSYDIRVRPWYRRDGDHGTMTVQTTDTTEYEIDEIAYTGQDGLDALAAMPQGTLTVAFGTLDLQSRTFTAQIVHAGTSLGGDHYSAILGNIVSRTGDQLVVKGAVAVARDRRAHFHRTVIVDIGPDTRVSKIGEPDAMLDTNDLSVGQRIVALGDFTNPQASSDPFGPDVALMLDATEGHVRMLVTHLLGSVNSFVPGQLNMNLLAIDRLGVGMFDFTGTGISPMDDADPADYEVETGTLALDALEVDRPVRVFGFVNRFGEAPPDFAGRTVVSHRDLPAALGIGWTSSGTSAPLSSMGPQSIVLDLSNPDIGLLHHMWLGPVLVDLFDLPASPSIEPHAVRGLYAIWEPGHVELFSDFTEFVDELALRLGGADKARSLAAYGTYDESGNSVTARHIAVHMLPAD